MSEAQNQEQGPQVGTHSKDAPWYSKPLVNLTPPARELLENYSGIPAEDVEAHVMEVVSREKDMPIRVDIADRPQEGQSLGNCMQTVVLGLGLRSSEQWS